MPEFVIHALPVGGGILALAPLPGAGGDYAGDLEHLHDWKPALVLSMTTPTELLEAGAPDLGADIQDIGSRWFHLPVPDYGVPGAQVDADWPPVSQAARAALKGGGRVLIHCRGGCGRSGMVALRLMIEIGERADDALLRLRAVRPCAIETDDQERWARKGRRQKAVRVS